VSPAVLPAADEPGAVLKSPGALTILTVSFDTLPVHPEGMGGDQHGQGQNDRKVRNFHQRSGEEREAEGGGLPNLIPAAIKNQPVNRSTLAELEN
jgi:hypothetical protein